MDTTDTPELEKMLKVMVSIPPAHSTFFSAAQVSQPAITIRLLGVF